MKGNDISLEEMNLNALNINHEFEMESEVENENSVGKVPKFDFNTISNQNENILKADRKIDRKLISGKPATSSKLLQFSKINQLLNSKVFKWMKNKNSPEPIYSGKGTFQKFQIDKKGKQKRY